MYQSLLKSLNRLNPRAWDFIQLTRMDKPIGIYLLLWPTLWALWIAGKGSPSLANVVIFVLGVVLTRAGGCVINDWADRKVDGHVKRTAQRPLAAGRISSKEALVFFALLMGVSFLLVLCTNAPTIWLSLGGLALAFTYPFMKRYTKAFLAKNPELAGKDLEITKAACELFKRQPVTVVNYLEGTRYTAAKSSQQQSPFNQLLKPKAGGVAFVLAAMGEQLDAILDVIVVYPQQKIPGFWDLISGGVPRVIVDIQTRELDPALWQGDYANDPVFREKVQNWVNQLWTLKDQR
ncbi:MAG: acetyltransferase, partial [Pseudomonas sp.]